MPVMSIEEAGRFLEESGLQPVQEGGWMGFQRIGAQVFPVRVHLTEGYIEVAIMQNLFTPCNQPGLHRYLTQANSQVTIGKFAVGPESDEDGGQGGGRPLILSIEFPAGSRGEYTSNEEIAMLLHFAFELVEKHHGRLQDLVGQGCDASAPAGDDEPDGGGLFGRLRSFRRAGRQS